ncbi:MAG: 50S ribosome-binding GTPase [Candidatus Accumulibacter sp.]|nr:50S ribosome-binding GTPase [Accumulibacter sp.]
MDIVITGHVDHGKSTLIGRLLADTRALPDGKLESVRQSCSRNGRVFEYSMLLDALEDEQRQGITIDSARVFFKSERREYVLIDAPGHIEFLRNMLSGASRAVAALLVIDALEGVAENSRRHGLLLSLLGINQVVVAINKLDRLDYDESAFRRVKNEYEAYLDSLDVKPVAFVPVSAREGKNLMYRAPEMPWYQGKTILEVLEGFQNAPVEEDAPFTMPLQDIYRFSNNDDDRRIYAGTIASGKVRRNDLVRFLPSNKEAHVRTIESWNVPEKTEATVGEAAGFTLLEDIYVRSGEVLVKADENHPVVVATKIAASMIWLGSEPFSFERNYLFKLGNTKTQVRLEKIERILGDAPDGDYYGLRRNECGNVILGLSNPVALTRFQENFILGRFVIVDGFDAAGGGIVLAPLIDSGQDSSKTLEFEEELFLLLRKHFPHRFRNSGGNHQDYSI